MAETKFTRVHTGDYIRAEHLNQYADHLERAGAQSAEAPSVASLAVLAAAASVSAKPLARRSVLFPWRRK